MRNGTYCTVIDTHGKECRKPLDEGATISVCYRHHIQAALAVREMRTPEADLVFDVNKGRSRGVGIGPRGVESGVVYYLRNGDEVKIGTTVDLPRRLRDLRHHEVMAIEPGGRRVEKVRHRAFQDDRLGGEWFALTPSLAAHIKEMRSTHGEPMEAWKSVVRVAPRADLLSALGVV